MKKATFLLSLMLLMIGLVGQPVVRAETSWQAKVDNWVLTELATEGEAEVLVFMVEQADLSGADALLAKEAKGAYVTAELQQVANASQAKLLEFLDKAGGEYRSFWIANMVWVRGDEALLSAVAQRADVAHLYANPTVRNDLGVGDGVGAE
ncbi:MAG TPA: hypothetical protein VLL52_23165, partial [Anaerolineae bacterium]|nr:hypothetical protein [Anaerolineae bacterium]